MKKILSIILSLSILIATAFTVSAITMVSFPEEPDFVFGVEGDVDGTTYYSICEYKGEDVNVTIPESVLDKDIKGIYEKGFYENQVIQSLTLNNKITQIKTRGIYNCDSLTKIAFSKSLTDIGKYGVAYNDNIQSIFLKNTSVNNLYLGCFIGDVSLKYISLPNSLKVIQSQAFVNTSLEMINIPDGTTVIGDSAFADIATLKAVYIPESVINIGENLFDNSENVTVYTTENSAIYDYCIANNVNCVVIESDEFPSDLLGDTNDSGKVTIRDATAIQMELANIGNNKFIADNCDVNGDSVLDINDVTYLQKYLAKLVDLPVE